MALLYSLNVGMAEIPCFSAVSCAQVTVQKCSIFKDTFCRYHKYPTVKDAYLLYRTCYKLQITTKKWVSLQWNQITNDPLVDRVAFYQLSHTFQVRITPIAFQSEPSLLIYIRIIVQYVTEFYTQIISVQ